MTIVYARARRISNLVGSGESRGSALAVIRHTSTFSPLTVTITAICVSIDRFIQSPFDDRTDIEETDEGYEKLGDRLFDEAGDGTLGGREKGEDSYLSLPPNVHQEGKIVS